MARDGHNCVRSLDGGVAKEVQKELGILAIYLQQHPLDYLGDVRQRVRPG